MIAGLDVLLCHIFSKNSNIYRCLVYKSNSFVKQIALSVILRCFYLLYTYVSLLLLRFTLQLSISYKKLWKLLIDRDMKKKDLMALAGVSQSSITKMGHNDNVNTEVLVKICLALNCDLGDIAEIILPEEQA